jgi:hypothetical protein
MRTFHKERQPSRCSRKQKVRRKNLNPSIMKNLMWKKLTLLENFRKEKGSTKASCLSNFLTVARLAILQPSVPIPRRTLNMKETKLHNTRRRKNPTTRKKITKGKRISTQKKKTTVHQIPVTVMNLTMMKSFFYLLKSLKR